MSVHSSNNPKPGTSPATTRRQQQSQETRARLIETALSLFARNGVDATSVKEIAHGAGVAQGLLYHYFAGKDDLLWGVLEAHTFMPGLQEVLSAAADRPVLDVLWDVVRGFDVFLGQRQPLVHLIMRELQTNLKVNTLWEQSIRREEAVLQEFLATRVRSGELRPHDLEVTTHLLMYGVVLLYLPGGGTRAGNDAFLKGMVETLMRGVCA